MADAQKLVYPPTYNGDDKRHIQLIVKYGSFSKTAELAREAAANFSGVGDMLNKAAEDANSENFKFITGEAKKKLKKNATRVGSGQTLGIFQLPLPNEFSDNMTHQWSTDNDMVNGFVAAGVSLAEDASGIKVGRKIFQNSIASKAGSTGYMINPGNFQQYDGSLPREFTFSWDFIPNNVSEAQAIIDIIFNLRRVTLPNDFAGGIGLANPFMFEIKFGNEVLDSMICAGEVVCRSMTVNFGEGGLAVLPDSMPKHINVVMSFAERTVPLRDWYDAE